MKRIIDLITKIHFYTTISMGNEEFLSKISNKYSMDTKFQKNYSKFYWKISMALDR